MKVSHRLRGGSIEREVDNLIDDEVAGDNGEEFNACKQEGGHCGYLGKSRVVIASRPNSLTSQDCANRVNRHAHSIVHCTCEVYGKVDRNA